MGGCAPGTALAQAFCPVPGLAGLLTDSRLGGAATVAARLGYFAHLLRGGLAFYWNLGRVSRSSGGRRTHRGY